MSFDRQTDQKKVEKTGPQGTQRKRELRSSFKQQAELFQSHESVFQTERLHHHLIDFLKTQEGTWAAFKAMGTEPRLENVIKVSSHLNWVFPKMVDDEIQFVDSTQFKRGSFGFDEPVGGRVIELNQIQGFIIPGVAFDREGSRLGRGKGHYDRMLAKAQGLRLGVCFMFQIYAGALPTESFDMKMDGLVSEHGLRFFGKGLQKWN